MLLTIKAGNMQQAVLEARAMSRGVISEERFDAEHGRHLFYFGKGVYFILAHEQDDIYVLIGTSTGWRKATAGTFAVCTDL